MTGSSSRIGSWHLLQLVCGVLLVLLLCKKFTGQAGHFYPSLYRSPELKKVLRPVEARGPQDPVMERMEKARQRVNSVKLLCWVMTGSDTINTKGRAVLETWGSQCNKLLFMTSVNDKTQLPGTVALPGVGEGREGLAGKSKEAWRYVYKHFRSDYDWFYKCDDDTYTVVENLKLMVSGLQMAKPYYLGFPLHKKVEWLSGGAGYILSGASLSLLEQQMSSPSNCMESGVKAVGGTSEDQLISHCLRRANVLITSSLDAHGKNRFLPLTPELHLLKGAMAKTEYKWILDVYSDRRSKQIEGSECCSDLAISFHYITADAQRTLHYLVHRLHVFGSRLSDLELPEVLETSA